MHRYTEQEKESFWLIPQSLRQSQAKVRTLGLIPGLSMGVGGNQALKPSSANYQNEHDQEAGSEAVKLGLEPDTLVWDGDVPGNS